MPILAMYSDTCTYERQLCFDVCFHLLSCFTRLPTSTALQATPNPTTPDVMGPPWPEHTRQSRNAPCPQSFGTLPSRRKKSFTNCWDYLRVKEHVKYACAPYLLTQQPCAHVYHAGAFFACFWSHEFAGRFFNVFISESPLTSTYYLRVDLQAPMTKNSLPLGFQQMIICALGAKVLAPARTKGCRPKNKGGTISVGI